MMETDALIVGGGPAGLATAIAAGLKGLRVIVVDSRQPPIDKPCGEGLLPDAVSALQSLGIELDSSLGVSFLGFRFSDENSYATATIPRGKAFGVRRTVLHRLLVERASEAGVSFVWGARISQFDSHGVSVNGDSIRYKWLVGADGQRSSVRRFAGLESLRHYRSRFGFRRHYAIAPWTDHVEVHWGEKCQMVVTPTHADEVCISLFTSDKHVRLDRALDLFPDVERRVRAALTSSAEGGEITALGRARAVVRRNVALVGDAGCAVDGIAGSGLSLAFQEALCLGEALAVGDLGQYESSHSRITRGPMRMTRLLLLMDTSTTIRRKVLRLFASRPAIFSNMISAHTGASQSHTVGPAEILGLGWRVLRA
jgi:flavin-dependent dehydrogenase